VSLEVADAGCRVEDGELWFWPGGPGGWPGRLEGCLNCVCVCDVDLYEMDKLGESCGEVSTRWGAEVEDTDPTRVLIGLEMGDKEDYHAPRQQRCNVARCSEGSRLRATWDFVVIVPLVHGHP
jgi:hypothetical protein